MEYWAPFAIRRDGPANKIGYPTRLWPLVLRTRYTDKLFVVNHSSEGSESSFFHILDSQANPRRSSTFFNPKVGLMYQCYPARAATWTQGDKQANLDGVSIEHEGVGAGDSLTSNQIENDVLLWPWLRNLFGWSDLIFGVTLREHWEFVPTACPSNRIPYDTILLEIARREGHMSYIDHMDEFDTLEEFPKALARLWLRGFEHVTGGKKLTPVEINNLGKIIDKLRE